MDARLKRGKRWFELATILVFVTALLKALIGLGKLDPLNEIVGASVQFFGGDDYIWRTGICYWLADDKESKIQ